MAEDKLVSEGLANESVFEKFDVPFSSPVQPEQLDLDDTIQFSCFKGIECFNACCKNIDITLTPYDVIRMSRRLGLTTTQFLTLFTTQYDLDAHGMPGIKLKPVEDSTACQLMTEEGCGIYTDRPTACRYYAMGMMGMRRNDEFAIKDVFFMVKEPHCKGHEQDRKLTVREYREEQGVEEFDELNRDWIDMIVKKRSAGPTVGSPSERSFQLFFLASYDLDSFRKFTQSEGFGKMFDLDDALREQLDGDDKALIRFASRFLKQVLFGEQSIDKKEGAPEQRYEERKPVIQKKHEENIAKYSLRDPANAGKKSVDS